MKYNYTILIVEDSEDSYNILSKTVPSQAKVYWAQTVDKAKELLMAHRFDLLLVDLMLPDGSGYEIGMAAQNNSNNQNAPLIYVSAKNETSDKVMGFSAGGDDYVEKPFDIMELRARVEAKLRKMDLIRSNSEQVEVGPVRIDLKKQEVRLYKDGGENEEPLDLTPIEFKILQLLTSEEGEVFPREKILDHVWGESVHVFPRSVDTHVSKVRKKLGPYKELIQSVHGSGYKFDTGSARA